MQTHAIAWFEIPVIEFDRARRFYSVIFDYTMPEMMMGDIRMGILPYQLGVGIGGAICQGESYTPGPGGTKVYLNAEPDLGLVLARVAEAGGQIVLPKTFINAETGYFALFTDPEGNLVGLYSRK